MRALTSTELTSFFLSVGVLLVAAKFCGEMVRRFNQPAIVGELLAGILLGPSILGTISPAWASTIVPLHVGRVPVLWDGLTTLAVTMFLLVAGMEVNLSRMTRQFKAVSAVSVTGMGLPFAMGLAVAWYFPHALGRPHGVGTAIFALFFATALSISALPVIAKTLFDLDLYDTDSGTIIIAAAMINDFSGWIIFGVLLAMMHGASTTHASGAIYAVVETVAFAVGTLTLGRWLVDLGLRWVQSHGNWLSSVMGFTLALAMFGGAIAESIGINAIFGGFLVGIAIGNSSALRGEDRSTIARFVASIFAPLFFVSLGLKVNFLANFDLRLVLIVFTVGCAGKILGVRLGAALRRLESRQAWAVAFGLNARGAMEIVLSVAALQNGLIQIKMFVALVLMALLTSMMSGPMMQYFLGLKATRHPSDASPQDVMPRPVTSITS